MTYAESWPEVVTRAEALREIRYHGMSVEDFLVECGDFDAYVSDVVLGWMGY